MNNTSNSVFTMNERQISMMVRSDQANTIAATDYKGVQIVCYEQDCLRESICHQKPMNGTCYAIEGNVVDRVSSKNGKGWCEDVSPTLNTQDRHAICFAWANSASAELSLADISPTIKAARCGEPAVCIALEGNGSRPSHMGKGFSEDGTMYTLNTIEQHSVCYSVDCRNLYLNEEKSATLQAKNEGGHSLNFLNPVLIPQCYAIENHPNDSRVRIDPDGIVQTLSSRMGTGGNNTPFVLINSSGDGIATTIDANYYKGCGQREGLEREYVMIYESISNDHGSVMCEQSSGQLHGTGCVQQYASGNKDG